MRWQPQTEFFQDQLLDNLVLRGIKNISKAAIKISEKI